jgi:hypothetical protein
MKKKFITLQIEFFKNQNPETIENQLRRLVKQRKFPAFRKCIPMVHYKNLKQIDLRDDFPMMVDDDDINKELEG